MEDHGFALKQASMISAHLRIPNFRDEFGTLDHVMFQCLGKIHFPRCRPILTLSKTSGPFHPGDLHGNHLTVSFEHAIIVYSATEVEKSHYKL